MTFLGDHTRCVELRLEIVDVTREQANEFVDKLTTDGFELDVVLDDGLPYTATVTKRP